MAKVVVLATVMLSLLLAAKPLAETRRAAVPLTRRLSARTRIEHLRSQRFQRLEPWVIRFRRIALGLPQRRLRAM
jgi:hypothetical protein